MTGSDTAAEPGTRADASSAAEVERLRVELEHRDQLLVAVYARADALQREIELLERQLEAAIEAQREAATERSELRRLLGNAQLQVHTLLRIAPPGSEPERGSGAAPAVVEDRAASPERAAPPATETAATEPVAAAPVAAARPTTEPPATTEPGLEELPAGEPRTAPGTLERAATESPETREPAAQPAPERQRARPTPPEPRGLVDDAREAWSSLRRLF